MGLLGPVNDLLENEERDDCREDGRCCGMPFLSAKSLYNVPSEMSNIRVEGESGLAKRIQAPSLDQGQIDRCRA